MAGRVAGPWWGFSCPTGGRQILTPITLYFKKSAASSAASLSLVGGIHLGRGRYFSAPSGLGEGWAQGLRGGQAEDPRRLKGARDRPRARQMGAGQGSWGMRALDSAGVLQDHRAGDLPLDWTG